ncbi:MAG TPA: cohesin domain-containing protein [bacterium]
MSSQKSWFVVDRILVLSLIILSMPSLLASQSLTLSISDTSAPANSLVKIPIRTTDVTGLGVRSIDITLTFDERILDALGANSLGSITESWGNPLTTDEPGKIRLIMVGVTDLIGEGVLTYVFFEVLGSKNDTTSIHLQNVKINDGMITAQAGSGKFTALEREAEPNLIFSFPDTSAAAGSIVELPVHISKLKSFAIDSLRLTVTFSKYVAKAFDVIIAGALTANWIDSVEALLPGKVSIFLKGSPALSDSGVLCKLRFQLVGNPGMSTPIHFQGIRIYQDSLKLKTRDGKVAIQGGTSSDVTISIPDISADTSSTVTVPIFISDVSGKEVQSASIELTFDNTVLTYKKYTNLNTLLNGWMIVENALPGIVKIGSITSGNFLSGQGVLIEFVFQVIGKPGMQTALHFVKMSLNEGNPSVSAYDGLFTVNYVIPVELASFTATPGQDVVTLNWGTVSETNNFGFEVERKNNRTEWQKVGFVPGHGTTTTSHHYFFHDKNINPGHFYYRLKQIDFNGTVSYSGIVAIVVENPQRFHLFQNHPNPFNTETKIEFEVPATSKIRLIIYDILGREIKNIDLGEFTSGHQQIVFNAENLNSGLYFYKLESGNFSDVKKLLILK